MNLEDQLAKLSELGLHLNEGVTVDDLVYSWKREYYEERPFELILFVLGIEVEREPWGRAMCSRVWNFDTECINATGDYVRIVKRLCQMSGDSNYLTGVKDFVDFGSRIGWLRYRVNDIERRWIIDIVHDWADMLTLSYVMDDIHARRSPVLFQGQRPVNGLVRFGRCHGRGIE